MTTRKPAAARLSVLSFISAHRASARSRRKSLHNQVEVEAMADVGHHLLEPHAATAATTTSVDNDHGDEGFTFATVPRLLPAGGESSFPDDGRRVSYYPVFGRPRSPPPPLQKQGEEEEEQEKDILGSATVRVPLSQLLLEERDSSSSSPSPGQQQDDGELHGVPSAETTTYCLWSPGGSPAVLAGSQAQSPQLARCQQESGGSTGSAVLWWPQRLLGGRSHIDDGKDKFAYVLDDTGSSDRNAKEGGDGDDGGRRSSSFLPYKKGLAGLFANAGAFRRSYHPF